MPELPHDERELALLYSGGLDSTSAALLLLRAGARRVHLHTWDTRRGLLFTRWVERAARPLLVRYPGRVAHYLLPIPWIFDRLVSRRLPRLLLRHRAPFPWCLGCKLSMHAATIGWCLARGVERTADGSAPDTPYYVEQHPVSLSWLREYHARWGLEFSTPLEALPRREDRLALVDREGLPRGRSRFGRNPGTQPLCLPGNLIYARSTFLGQHPRYEPGQLRAFLEDARPLLDRLVEEARRRLAP